MDLLRIMPIHFYNGGGGGMSFNSGVAMVIVANFFMLLWILGCFIHWQYKKKGYELFGHLSSASMWFMCFCIVNGLALLVWLTFKVEEWLK